MPIVHPIPPVFDSNSRVLILGSFPSVKSREAGFFYGHPQNRFWRVLAAVTGDDPGQTPQSKTAFLLRNHIALWDVLASCDISGSADSSIKNAVPNDLTPILETARVAAVFTNGKTADRLYRKFQLEKTGIPAQCLPSTSPANAQFSEAKLAAAWQAVMQRGQVTGIRE